MEARPATVVFVVLAALSACANQQPQPAPAAQPMPPAPAGAAPAGAVLLVRTDQQVDSRRQGNGHRFTVTLEANLVGLDGTVIAERGDTAHARITQSQRARRLAGRTEMTIELVGILIDNMLVPVSSSSVTAIGEGVAGDTVRRTGSSAIIGGAFGGSRGARRGAAIGFGLSAMSEGGHIAIPIGTILEFQLASHVHR